MTWRAWLSQWSSWVIALCLAIFVWVVASNEENPSREALFPDPIAIQLLNRAEGLTLSDKSVETVRVRVRTSQANWQNLRADNFRAVVDLKGLTSGEHQLSVNVTSANPQVSIVEVDYPLVTVRLEQLKQLTLSVRARVLDDAPLGYEFKNVTTQPTQVAVAGPESLIDAINDATADVALRGAKTAFERDVTVMLRDAQGNLIQNVTITPVTVSAHVDVVPRVGYKEVAVKAALKGSVSSGYWISDIRVEPPTVTLVGAAEALDKIPGFVETQAIVVTSAQENISKQVGLNLSAGVTALDAGNVMVQVAVEPVLGGITIRRAVTVSKVRCDLPVTISPDAGEVILSGPLPKLQALKADEVKIVVDVNGCAPGSFQASLRAVNVPDSIKVESIVPNTVEVNVKSR